MSLLAVATTPVWAERYRLPPGFDQSRLAEMERELKVASPEISARNANDRRPRVYYKLLYAPQRGDAVTLMGANGQKVAAQYDLGSLFKGVVGQSARFRLFDAGQGSGVEDVTTIYLHGQIVEVRQNIVDNLRLRQVVTEVKMRVILRETASGEDKYQKVVSGIWGDDPNEGTIIPPGVPIADAGVQQNLVSDYQQALRIALKQAAEYVEEIYRPVGRVLGVEGEHVKLYGGGAHGFHAGDRVIIFRAKLPPGVERLDLAMRIPLGEVECMPDAGSTSDCTVQGMNPNSEFQAGDYAILRKGAKQEEK
ncbi:MAG: hypothetical protein JNJ60_15540 [Rhodocyclaceae bacterium]|nr:hypothetical protein [Rhodocyclaceae bacterium]